MWLPSRSPAPAPEAIVVKADKKPEEPGQPHVLLSLHYTNPLIISAATALLLVATRHIYLRYFQRIQNVDMVTNDRLGGYWVRGVVTR